MLSYYRSSDPEITPFLQVDGEYINDKHALVTASINKTKLDPVSFNTTGASTHLNQSLVTRGIYAAPGKIAPNYRGAIGVSDSGVAGVAIPGAMHLGFFRCHAPGFLPTDTVYLNVTAFGNNWFKLERIDESKVVSRENTPES